MVTVRDYPQMSDLTLNYSIETLLHFTCECGQYWSYSVEEIDNVLILPIRVTCPDCGRVYTAFNKVSDSVEYCPIHLIWFSSEDCPMCNSAFNPLGEDVGE